MTLRSGWALLGCAVSAALLVAGAWWFSPGAGLVVAGVCVAVLTVLATFEVGGGDG